MTDEASRARSHKIKLPLSQETLTILAVGATLLTTMLVTTGRLEDRIDQYRIEAREEREDIIRRTEKIRVEAREDREALRAEARKEREAIIRRTEEIRVEARKDREALRAEAREAREALHTEGRKDREALRAEGREDREALRAEGREDREALRAEAREDRKTFTRQISDLNGKQAHLQGLVEGLRAGEDHPESTVAPSSGG